MIDPNKKENAPVQSSDVCRRAFELMHEKRYDEAEKLLVGNMAKTDDESAIALYHSVLGVLFKLQGEYKTYYASRGKQAVEYIETYDRGQKVRMLRLRHLKVTEELSGRLTTGGAFLAVSEVLVAGSYKPCNASSIPLGSR